MKNFKGLLRLCLLTMCPLSFTSIATAQSNPILTCTTSLCYRLTPEQMKLINNVISDEIKIENSRSNNKTPSFIILKNNKLLMDHLDDSDLADFEDKNLNVNMMSFRYSIDKKTDHYFAANTFIEKSFIRDNKTRATFSTVGLGKQIRPGWTVELGLVKYIKDSGNLTDPKPQGLFLMLKKNHKK